MKIGFIGLGNMGSAMIGGIIGNKVVAASDIIGADKSEERTKEIKDNETVVKKVRMCGQKPSP